MSVHIIVEDLGKYVIPKVVYLINNGEDDTDVTGGHIIRKLNISASVKQEDNCIILDSPVNYASGYVIQNPISEEIVSKYSKVFCEYEIVKKYDEWRTIYI